jgi:hypothetical protein
LDKQKIYNSIIEWIFVKHYKKGMKEFTFERAKITEAAKALKMDEPKNLGDLIYSFRYRKPFPDTILRTADKGMEWVIESVGRSKYKFKLVKISRIVPRENLVAVKIPDATPEIISAYALNDEQALLAKVRYNRLIDIFLGMATYSLQNHLRTTVKGIGQIEIDELYVGVDKAGVQYIVPVQAKGGKDQIGVTQAAQDIACCAEKYPTLVCRAISAQFMADDTIAMFELTVDDGQVRVVAEKHYKLVPSSKISPQDLKGYNQRSN